MARFYLTNTSAGYIPTDTKGTWSAPFSGALKLGTSKSGTQTYNTITCFASQNRGVRRFVSDPLEAQTISGTCGLGWGPYKESGSGVVQTRCHIWVTQGDSDNVRGTLLSNWNGHAVWGAYTTGGRVATGIALSSVACENNDRIVIELGAHETAAADVSCGGYYGGSGDDIVENDNTSTHAGWFEIEATVSASASRSPSASQSPSSSASPSSSSSASQSPSSSSSASLSPSSSSSLSVSASTSPSSSASASAPPAVSVFYDCGTPTAAPESLCDKRLVYAYVEWDITAGTTVVYE